MNSELFNAWLPGWQPDETLYSWCARYHRIAGGVRASQTSLRLFGHPRAGLAHDLGGRLTHLVEQTGSALGSVSDLLLTHTLLGYYMVFRPLAERELWTSRLAAGTQGAIKTQLGWLATRMGAAHPLKGCVACEAEDVAQGFSPYWRREHQAPGVWVCIRHQCTLWVTPLRANGLMRTMWLLPDDIPAHYRTDITLQPAEGPPLQTLVTVASVTHDLLEASAAEPIALKPVAQVLLRQLQERKLATASGRLHPDRLTAKYLEFVAPLTSCPEADAICVSHSAAGTLWRRLLKGRLMHPLRYVLACAWLLGRWPTEEIAQLCRSPAVTKEPAAPSNRRTRLRIHTNAREAFAQLISDGMSPTAAARKVGVDTSTALLWAASEGHTVKRKPKLLDPTLRTRLIKQLAAGKPKTDLAEQSGLSVVTITRLLLSTPGLKLTRDQAIAGDRRRRAQRRLETLSRKHPSWGLANIRLRAAAEYAWLYRNDRDWLTDFASRLPTKAALQPPRVDWALRDQLFASEVKKAAEVHLLHATPNDPFMRMKDFARLVPGLHAKLRNLDRMPETAKALRSAAASMVELKANNSIDLRKAKMKRPKTG